MNTTVGQVFRRAAAAVLLSALTSLAAPAQRFNISTNLMEYANLGTLNLDVSYGVARNWSATRSSSSPSGEECSSTGSSHILSAHAIGSGT